MFDSKKFLKTLTAHPGVYQMENEKGEVLYVGKASNLKNRVSSYFTKHDTGIKTKTLVSQIAHISVTITASDSDALFLENSLIKKYKPKYNILLRDDKSYPYLFVSMAEKFPRIEFYRGKKRDKKGLYFGPYPSATAVKETLYLLQKIFKIRSCSPSFFSHRSRPCLQHQIQRCSAPCVNLITSEVYRESIQNAVLFLQGKNQALIHILEKNMEKASRELAFEKAAQYRDQIMNLQQIQSKKPDLAETEDIDILAISIREGMACVHKMHIRSGQSQGGRNFFPSVPNEFNKDSAAILEAFITQYYGATEHHDEIPHLLILSENIPEAETISTILTQIQGKKCQLSTRVRGIRLAWLKIAKQNSEMALLARLGSESTLKNRFKALQMALNLPVMPQLLECFDISHTMGEATTASCVVFDQNGPKKNDYRRLNINMHEIQPGDDYAAMRQAIFRRYLQREESLLPDILFIDGGKGQVKQALEILEALKITRVLCIGVAKGPSRKAGLETLILSGKQEIMMESDSPALHLIQHIRDESHRFALLGHIQKRDKKRTVSVLEAIEGIGAKRRQALYRRFGGLQEVKKSSVDALAQVPGISRALAEKIYQALH